MARVTTEFGEIFYTRPSAGSDDETLPLILVHGAGETHLHWSAGLRRLQNAQVYALDLPGHGRSGGQGSEGIGVYADAVHAFIQALDLAPCVVAGHSMGGAIALDLALRYATDLVGLIVVGAGARLPVADAILGQLLKDFEGVTAQVVAWAYASGSDDDLTEQALERLREVDPETLLADFTACARFDVSAEIDRIAVETLVICGERDRMTPLRQNRRLQQGIPNARLAIVEGVGHMVQLEASAEVEALFTDFLTDISLPTRTPAENSS